MLHDQGLSLAAAAVLVAASLLPHTTRAADCDFAAGQAAFGKCAACHSLEAGKNVVGPSLHGLDGRAAGGAGGFGYSPALKNSGITWNAEALDRFLADPQAVVPGNRMPFTGIRDDKERAAVTCYVLGAQRGTP